MVDNKRTSVRSLMDPKVRQAYVDIFTSPQGKLVLRDLQAVTRRNKLDPANPNPDAALYKVAQTALINRILAILDNRDDEE